MNNIDPLDELINKHKIANGEEPTPIVDSKPNTVPPVPETLQFPVDGDGVSTQIEGTNFNIIEDDTVAVTADDSSSPVQEVDYGDNDKDAAIAAEDAAREAERLARYEAQKAAREAEEAKLTAMPPQPHDTAEQKREVDFQADNINIVTGLVNRVVAKYKLFEGGIPDDTRMMVMGELMEHYHHYGNVITEEFEQVILNNWVMPDGSYAAAYIKNPHPESTEEKKEEKSVETVPATDPSTVININVESGTPVNVNVDGDVVKEMTNTKTIEVFVNEVTEKELKSATIIENSQLENIITEYDSGINDVPVTLPASAYRCVMKSIAWFDFIRLIAPTSGARADDELRKWSVLFKHLKNPSIGKFKDFEDFMKHTKYQDRELLMWALLVATADEEETLALTCANPKCKAKISLKYRPREIVHLDEEHIPKYYKQTHDVPYGDEAIKLHNDSAYRVKRYKLPDTGIIVDITEPSAYDFINNKLALLEELYERYVPDGDISELNPNDPAMAEFDYLSSHALYITAMSVPKDGKEYRYTNWDDIENIITESLSTDDSAILLKVIQESRANTSPVSFRIKDINCPACRRHEDHINITDIGNTLLFQVSRRLDNTKIKLTEMP